MISNLYYQLHCKLSMNYHILLVLMNNTKKYQYLESLYYKDKYLK